MSENLERGASPEPGKKIERFEDFELEEGDLIYSKSGKVREIMKIVEDEEFEGGGYIETKGTDSEGKQSWEVIFWQELVDGQRSIARIEKPHLRDGLTLDSNKVSPRHRAALKQIESQLNDPSTPAENKRHLKLSRAQIIREINEKTGSDEGTYSGSTTP